MTGRAGRIDRASGHSFFPIRSGGIVLDLGYNRGEFAEYVSRAYDARVVAVEPDPRLLAPTRDPRIELRPVAVGDGRPTELALNEHSDASVVFGEGRRIIVETVTLESLVGEHQLVDLVKMDVEGAEIDALRHASAERLQRVAQISVEFHDFLDPVLGPRVGSARAHLAAAGFVELRFSRDNSDVLYVNRSRFPIGQRHRFWLLLRYRYASGLLRVARRYARVAEVKP